MTKVFHPLAFLVYDKYKKLFENIASIDNDFNFNEIISIIELYWIENEYDNSFENRLKSEVYHLYSLGIETITDSINEKMANKVLEDIKRDAEINANRIIDMLIECEFFERNNGRYALNQTFGEIKIHMESISLDDFVKNFSKTLQKITQEQLDYINDILDDTRNVHNEKFLTLADLQKIKYIAYSISELERQKITTSSYKTVYDKYEKFKKKSLEIHNIVPSIAPIFSNPTQLYIKIDQILTKTGLTNEQKNIFFKEVLNRDRVPKQAHVKSTLIESWKSDFMNKFRLLEKDEQDALASDDKAFEYSTNGLEFKNNYTEDQIDYMTHVAIHESRISFTQEDKKDSDAFEEEMRINKIKKLEIAFLKFPFDSAISSLFDESISCHTPDSSKIYKELF